MATSFPDSAMAIRTIQDYSYTEHVRGIANFAPIKFATESIITSPRGPTHGSQHRTKSPQPQYRDQSISLFPDAKASQSVCKENFGVFGTSSNGVKNPQSLPNQLPQRCVFDKRLLIAGAYLFAATSRNDSAKFIFIGRSTSRF